MEIQKVIEYLNQQRSMIDETIVCLERLSEGAVISAVHTPIKRRGRKFMDANDRQKVSERMKEYWATRRGQRTHSATGGAS